MFAMAVADGELLIMVGPFAVVIKAYKFKKRNRKKHPNEL
jgi:hypothetical protein